MPPPVFILLQALPVRWQSPWLLPAVLGLGAVLTAAVLWYYPGQVRLVRRPWRYVIPLLRLLAFTALAVSIARPVALRARPADDKGALLILIDRSASMGIADLGRKPSDLVSLADALGLLPSGLRAEASASIAAEFEQLQATVGQAIRAQGDLDYARVSGRGIEAAETRVRRSVEEGRALGRSLAGRLLSISGDGGSGGTSSVQDKLKPLSDLPPADLRGAWIAETRRRLDQASAAMSRFQDATDRKLYESNPGVRSVCDELDRRTRLETAIEALVRPGGLLSKLDAQTPVYLFGFDQNAVALPTPSAAPRSATQPVDVAKPSEQGWGFGDASPVVWTSSYLPMAPVGAGSDLAGALSQALAATEGRSVRGVMIISDGQQVGGASSTTAAVLPPGVPLITVSAAAITPPPDASIVDVEAPSAAFTGETFNVRVRVRGTGGITADASTVRITIAGSDEELTPAAVGKPDAKTSDGSTIAQFAVRIDRPGVTELVVRLPAADDEVTGTNNTVRQWVKVLPERIRVATYAGSPGWDFQYLRSALTRRDWFAVESGVLDVAKPKLPLSPSQILAQDVLILYDVPVEALDREQWYAVDRLVTQRGGSVLLIAGPSFNPASYVDQPLASALLPFNLQLDKKPSWRQWPGDRPSIRLIPGPEFLRSDVLRLADSDLTNRRWQDLSGMWRIFPVRYPRPGVRTILRDAETSQAVVTELRSGAGRCFYVGTHETWRWRGKVSESAHERFWRQLVRYAAEEPYAAQVGRLSLDLDQVAVAPGTAVNARVRVLPSDATPLQPATASAQPLPSTDLPTDLRLEVLPAGATGPQAPRPLRVQPLSQLVDAGGRARLAIGDLPPGQYEVRLGSPTAAGTQPVWPTVPLRVETTYAQEMKTLAGDADRLRRMAESTGGRMLRLDQLAAVPGLLAAAADQRPRLIEWSLWDSPWLFVFVVGCLGAEWALRKRAGLA